MSTAVCQVSDIHLTFPMTEDNRNPVAAPPPPDEFVEQVKQVLAHLYDFSYLQRHPLARLPGMSAQAANELPGQQLRRQVISAIEALDPGQGVGFRSPRGRLYNLLNLRYLEDLSVQEAAREVGVSERQAYRDLQHGAEVVATILWARLAGAQLSLAPAQAGADASVEIALEASSVEAELARLELRPSPVNLAALLEYASSAVEPLALSRGVQLTRELPAQAVTTLADPAVARQVLVNTLSQAVEQALPGSVHIALDTTESAATITFRFAAPEGAPSTPLMGNVLAELAGRLGWLVHEREEANGARRVQLEMPLHGQTVLVIDDNEGLVALIRRYLSDQATRVAAATDGAEGLRLAQELLPAAIVLDVMMPGMDGWQVLQRLTTHPRTAHIPVIVCTVFRSPQLAYSLGASVFLAKPVTREDILGALRRLRVL